MNPLTSLLKSATLALMLVGGAAMADDSPTMLTVTGDVTNPNRAGFSQDNDKFFGHYDVDFKNAAMFSFDKLQGLKTVSVKADFPKGRQVHTYEGPLLADVLAAAGAAGKTVTVQALDGYAVEAPLEEMIAKGAVVAYKRDGKMFGIGDFGPTQIVFPRAERDDLKDMNDDLWVWSIFHIRVE
ncbi:MAG: hypothetical protein KDA67_07785 [Rhodobacteraceae bacterium]|nr:hypothetical protein [Paracoccaceae bacterium]